MRALVDTWEVKVLSLEERQARIDRVLALRAAHRLGLWEAKALDDLLSWLSGTIR